MKRKPFRFGVASYGAATGAEWIAKAQRAEELGYSTLLVPDHFVVQIATVPALAAAAAVTTKLRVGSIVFGNDFRHPILLAKEAATIDFLSNGRFELGLGAGWLKAEYDAIGVPFDPPDVRVGRLEESIKVIKSYFGESPVTFSGQYYNVDGAKGVHQIPLPVQKPHPPILIGAGGKRMLSLAAREADIIGIIFRTKADGTGPDFADVSVSLTQKVDWIKGAAGDRFKDIELNVLTVAVAVTNNKQQTMAELFANLPLPAETMLSLPFALVGSEEEITGELEEYREQYGITYYIIWDRDMEMFAPVVARMAGK